MISNGEYIKDILAREPGTKVAARGWVKTRRDGKGVHFVQLQDGSSAIDLQVVILAGLLPEAVLAAVTTGSSLPPRHHLFRQHLPQTLTQLLNPYATSLP